MNLNQIEQRLAALKQHMGQQREEMVSVIITFDDETHIATMKYAPDTRAFFPWYDPGELPDGYQVFVPYRERGEL